MNKVKRYIVHIGFNLETAASKEAVQSGITEKMKELYKDMAYNFQVIVVDTKAEEYRSQGD